MLRTLNVSSLGWITAGRKAASAVLSSAGAAPALSAVLLIGIIDVTWSTQARASFSGWWIPLLAVLFLLLLSLFYSTVRSIPALAELPMYAALWITFTVVGAISTYLAASAAQPLQDAAFTAFDAGLGFDWVTWSKAIRARPVLNMVLRLAYDSLMPQIIGTIVLFALAKVRGRNEELLLAASVSLLLTSAVSGFLPALGPWVHYGYGALDGNDTAYVPHVQALRDGISLAFVLSQVQGIVCFPSYHTVLAVLLVHAHRGLRWSLPLVGSLNALMLLSIPSEGGHYLSDMVAGAVVALLTLAVVRRLRRPS